MGAIQPTHRPTPRTNSLNCHCEAIYRRGNLKKIHIEWGGLLTSDTSANSSAAVTYTYDTAGRLTEIHRGNTVYTIVYDEWGNQKEIKVGNTALSTNTFEQGNGNLTNTTYGNDTSVDFIYDKLDRLTSKKINGVAQFTQVFNNTGAIAKYNDLVTGVSWKYSYDLIGRLADITGSNNNIYRYIYDSNNRLGTVKYTVGGSTNATSYTYNAIGMAVKATNGGNSVEHSYDALGRKSGTLITTENQKTANVAYTYIDIDDERTTGLVKTVTNPLGTYTYEYDDMGRVYTANGGTVGNMYTYTPQGYIQGDYGPYPIHMYSYDAYGNITQLWDMTNDPILYGYTNTAWGDLLTSYNGTTFTYDAIGNPNNWRDGMTFSWQKGRQLASIVKNGATYSYAYDSSGVRTSKTVNGVTTHYTYVDGKLVHQTDGTNVWWFTYDSTGNILFMEYNGDVYYYLIDGIGNIVGLVDADNNVVATYVYEAYGEIYSATGTMAQINPIRYKQYYYDTETGFYYLMSRYYDPVIARFINADSFASTGQGTTGYNMFAYCGNNPVMYCDPTGEVPWLIAIVITAIVAVTLSSCSADSTDILYPEVTNCYAYAIGLQSDPSTDQPFKTPLQPGELAGNPLKEQHLKGTPEEVKNNIVTRVAADADTLNYTFKEVSGPNHVPARGNWLIALAVSPEEIDYHWWKKSTYNDRWSNKFPTHSIKGFDESGNLIFDPATCDRGVYTVFLGYYEIGPNKRSTLR